MSSFETFLTKKSRRNHHGQVVFRQKFLRQRTKHRIKKILPTVNIDPLMDDNESHQYAKKKLLSGIPPLNKPTYSEKIIQHRKDEKSRLDALQKCSHIVPTVGLTNLIFYDHKFLHNDKSMSDDSVAKLVMETMSSTENYEDESFVQIPTPTSNSDSNIYDGTLRDPAEISDDFDNLLSSSSSRNVDLFSRISNIFPFDASFELEPKQNNKKETSDSKLSSQFNAPDRISTDNFSENVDTTIENMSVSSFSSIGSIGGESYSDFLPLRTSTPIFEYEKQLKDEQCDPIRLLDLSMKEFCKHENHQDIIGKDMDQSLHFTGSDYLTLESTNWSNFECKALEK